MFAHIDIIMLVELIVRKRIDISSCSQVDMNITMHNLYIKITSKNKEIE